MNIIYLKTPQCSACHAMEPKAKELAGKYNIPFETIDLIENPEIRGKFMLFTAPAIIFMDEDREIKRFVRNFGLNEVEEFIHRVQ